MVVQPTPAEPTFSEYFSSGLVSYEMNKDGARTLELIETGEILFSEGNANWGDGGFELDAGREDISNRGTESNDILRGTS